MGVKKSIVTSFFYGASSAKRKFITEVSKYILSFLSTNNPK
jgi:hypothetical protein